MVLPISFQTKLKAVSRDIDQADRRFRDLNNLIELSSGIADYLYALHLLLDRAQNHVWEKYNSKRPDSKKANIYFPKVESREKLMLRLEKDQIPDLNVKNLELFQAILSVQPLAGESQSWWARMYLLNGSRHERDPDIVPGFERTVVLGTRQSMRVRSVSFNPDSGRIFADVDPWNPKTGKAESLNVEINERGIGAFREINAEAIPFARLCLKETENLLKLIFHLA